MYQRERERESLPLHATVLIYTGYFQLNFVCIDIANFSSRLAFFSVTRKEVNISFCLLRVRH